MAGVACPYIQTTDGIVKMASFEIVGGVYVLASDGGININAAAISQTEVTVCTFPNGCRITVYKNPRNNSIAQRAYNSNNQLVQDNGYGEQPLDLSKPARLVFYYDSSTQYQVGVGIAAYTNRRNQYWLGIAYTSGLNSCVQYITGITPIIFKSWEQLFGNNNQYLAKLLMIKDASIPDTVNGYHGFSSSDFDIVPTSASIWNSFLNSELDSEHDIAWSGNCRLTLTVSNNLSDAAIKIFTFKFYFPETSSPFYTYTQNVPISSSTPSNNVRNYYLSFLYDNNKQFAVFYPILYVPQSSALYQTIGSGVIDEETMGFLWLWLQASGAGEPTSPYESGTTDNGGQPTTDLLPNNLMPTVTAPTLAGTASGLFTIYCPDDTDLANIAAFLWSDSVLDNFKKYFNNFSDNIIALYVLPYKPSNLPTKAFKVGRVVSDTITSVEYVTTRFVTIDMGEVTVGGCWDSYLDFSPYTKFNVYLPGIGVEALDADDILAPLDRNKNFSEELGSTISLEYNLDLMTGIVVAYVKINGQIRYQFSGKIGYSIPLTGETHRTLLQGFAMATAGAIGTIASGGTAAPFAAAAASAAIINAMKPDVYRGSNLSGDAASLCYETPYLIRRVPNKPQLVNQDRFTGFQSYKTGLLSEFSGYTEVEEVHAEGFVCTEEERAEIIELLKKGVIL